MLNFQELHLARWRQFENINLKFTSNLCVLTGRNGCGKTTILNVLGRHFGWNVQFVSTPFISRKRENKFWNDVWDNIENDFLIPSNAPKVGEILYNNGQTCELFAPVDSKNAQYQLRYGNQLQVFGLHIPSHRTVATYHQIQNIPTDPKTNQQQFEEFQNLLLQNYGSGNHRNPGLILKQSIISLALFGYGNTAVASNREYIELFESFQNILKTMLPKEIGFEKLEIRMPDIVLVTKSGDFNLDAMSGGLAAIFTMAWQIHMYGADKQNCTIIIDEPENHLHPSMQQEFLPNLKSAFPTFRFIIATHSPFILSSFPEAQVYALTYNASSRITVTELSEIDLSGSADKILKEVLGLSSTSPKWVEERVANVLKKYFYGSYNEENIKLAFEELKKLGLNDSLKDFHV